jgi:16S rRNA (cytosine1402-N4)-methyltransferase
VPAVTRVARGRPCSGSGRYIASTAIRACAPTSTSSSGRQASLQPRLLRGDFSIVLRQLATNGVEADAILLDLGISSMQLDHPDRGFSYATDVPLDMRMDRSAELTAADLINDATERDLADIFKRYGEERYARQIARMIVRRRPLTTSFELVDVVKAAIPAPRALR